MLQVQRSMLDSHFGNLAGKPVRADRLHLTLAFVGAQAASKLPVLRAILTNVPARAMTLQLDTQGYFARPRIAWVGLSSAPPALLALHAGLTSALAAILPAADVDCFRPHVTLLRHAAPRPAAAPFAPICWRASNLVLVESMPDSGDYAIIAARHLA